MQRAQFPAIIPYGSMHFNWNFEILSYLARNLSHSWHLSTSTGTVARGKYFSRTTRSLPRLGKCPRQKQNSDVMVILICGVRPVQYVTIPKCMENIETCFLKVPKIAHHSVNISDADHFVFRIQCSSILRVVLGVLKLVWAADLKIRIFNQF